MALKGEWLVVVVVAAVPMAVFFVCVCGGAVGMDSNQPPMPPQTPNRRACPSSSLRRLKFGACVVFAMAAAAAAAGATLGNGWGGNGRSAGGENKPGGRMGLVVMVVRRLWGGGRSGGWRKADGRCGQMENIYMRQPCSYITPCTHTCMRVGGGVGGGGYVT